MAKGHPDWQPPSAPGAFDVVTVQTAVAGDVTTAPGVGFRQVIYGIMANSDPGGTALVVVSEYTSANVLVRRILLGKLAAGATVVVPYFGLPLAENNKLRTELAPGTTLYLNVNLRT